MGADGLSTILNDAVAALEHHTPQPVNKKPAAATVKSVTKVKPASSKEKPASSKGKPAASKSKGKSATKVKPEATHEAHQEQSTDEPQPASPALSASPAAALPTLPPSSSKSVASSVKEEPCDSDEDGQPLLASPRPDAITTAIAGVSGAIAITGAITIAGCVIAG